jgi:hypothetical protein
MSNPKTVVVADKETSLELSKAGAGFQQRPALLVDGREIKVNKQNGDGKVAYYKVAGQANTWITCDSVEKFLD